MAEISTYMDDVKAVEISPLERLQHATDALREAERHLGDAEHMHHKAHMAWAGAAKAVSEWLEENSPRRPPTVETTEADR